MRVNPLEVLATSKPVQSSRQSQPLSPPFIGREQLHHIINNDDFVPRWCLYPGTKETKFYYALLRKVQRYSLWDGTNTVRRSKSKNTSPRATETAWSIAGMQSDDKWSRFSLVGLHWEGLSQTNTSALTKFCNPFGSRCTFIWLGSRDQRI